MGGHDDEIHPGMLGVSTDRRRNRCTFQNLAADRTGIRTLDWLDNAFQVSAPTACQVRQELRRDHKRDLGGWDHHYHLQAGGGSSRGTQCERQRLLGKRGAVQRHYRRTPCAS
jgi:hypothetical protein